MQPGITCFCGCLAALFNAVLKKQNPASLLYLNQTTCMKTGSYAFKIGAIGLSYLFLSTGCFKGVDGYDCVSGTCQEVADGNFSSLAACQQNCSSGGSGNIQVTFWVETPVDLPITVYVNGQSLSITSYYPSGATCGYPGCATFSLPPGTYSWNASASSGTWSNSSTWSSSCHTMKLNP
jgi:hypothetical protein